MSPFKLGPKQPGRLPLTSLPTQVSARPDSPTAEEEKIVTETEAAKSSDSFFDWINILRKARKEHDKHAIEECFDIKHKNEFFPQTPYDWEVWKHTQLLANR